jgi:hypothetical protein
VHWTHKRKIYFLSKISLKLVLLELPCCRDKNIKWYLKASHFNWVHRPRIEVSLQTLANLNCWTRNTEIFSQKLRSESSLRYSFWGFQVSFQFADKPKVLERFQNQSKKSIKFWFLGGNLIVLFFADILN